jgi:hypothetical protein
LTVFRAPDGSESRTFYDEPARPSEASPGLGERVRSVDPVGRERWTRTDALGRLSAAIEPAPDGDGSVFSPDPMVTNLVTKYSWNALDRLEKIEHGTQMPRVDLPEILLKIASRTAFTDPFAHLIERTAPIADLNIASLL